MLMKCNRCKEESELNPFFTHPSITYRHGALYGVGEGYHVASVTAKALCPHCGNTIIDIHERVITIDNIILIATGKV